MASQHIAKSEILSSNSNYADVLVHWGLEEMQTLTKIYDHVHIPSPIIRDYKWPGMFTPFDHQKTTASFLSLRDRAC